MTPRSARRLPARTGPVMRPVHTRTPRKSSRARTSDRRSCERRCPRSRGQRPVGLPLCLIRRSPHKPGVLPSGPQGRRLSAGRIRARSALGHGVPREAGRVMIGVVGWVVPERPAAVALVFDPVVAESSWPVHSPGHVANIDRRDPADYWPPLIPPPGTQSPISLAFGPLQGFWLPPG